MLRAAALIRLYRRRQVFLVRRDLLERLAEGTHALGQRNGARPTDESQRVGSRSSEVRVAG
jgi:hypothetical protein